MNRAEPEKRRIALWLGVLVVAVMLGRCGRSSLADDGPRLKYDKQCVTIDGKDTVIFSAAFHYFRCPKELWRDRFRKLKDAGFNTVETYVAWNWHEQTPPTGVDDFSKLDMTDLNDWLAMATDEFGLNVYIRPGPYICAEWDGGGYPQWLVTQKPADFKKPWMRGNEPTYLAWCKHWFTAVAKTSLPYLITHRPAGKAGIILWQIENEYNYASFQPADVKRAQLDFLAHTSRDLGIDVPLTTCMTNDPSFRADDYLKQNVVETRNTYPKYSVQSQNRDLTFLDNYQPEKFRMVTELQGGWFAQVGGKLSEEQGFDASHINHVTLYAWEQGFTATNYYMGFGGTNLGDWAASTITTTYDYDAPVRETGGVTERYFAVKALGDFLKEHGERLSRAVTEKFDGKNKTDDDVTVTLRKAADGSRYLFVRTEQRDGRRKGSVTIATAAPHAVEITANYELGPFGSKVLYLPPGATSDTSGQWYPKAVQGPKRPELSELPAPVKITEARTIDDPGPTEWKPIQPGQGEESAGIFNRGFVFYRATIPPLPQEGRVALSYRTRGRDWARFQLNGKLLSTDPKGGNYTLAPSTAGEQLLGIYENFGRPNGGAELDRTSGIADLRITNSVDADRPLTQWRMKRADAKKHTDEISPKTDDSSWTAADINVDDGNLKAGDTAVYRTWIDLTDADLASEKSLVLGRVDDEGSVTVNGKTVGECHDWSQSQRFDLGKNLHAGKNLIAVVVTNRDGVGGLARGASLESNGPAIASQWQISDQSGGVAGKWWDSGFDDSSWRATKLGDSTTPVESAPLLSWYRMKFDLPEPKPTMWVPWKLRLDAVGNGFLYLNGHALGRWWQVGPQRDFYLPECWLNVGAGKTNVLTISLRPTDGVGVKSAEVGPYEKQAEMR